MDSSTETRPSAPPPGERAGERAPFVVSFAAHRGDGDGRAVPNAAGWEVVSGGRQIPPVEREALTILIAEDEESIGEFLADLLSSEGYRVIVVADGRAALACARCERPAMILSDCMMPGLDGLQLVRELRRHPATRAIPVALMSSTRPRGLDLFAVPFLAKPFELIDVLDLIARCTDAPRNTQLYGEG